LKENNRLVPVSVENTAARAVRALARAKRPLLALLLVGLGVSLVLEGVFIGMATTQTGCSTCHVTKTKLAELAESPHRDQDCRSCHVPGGAVGMVRLNVMAATNLLSWPFGGSGSTTGHSFSPVCASCHRAALETTVVASGIRMNHAAVTAEPRAQERDDQTNISSGGTILECSFCHADASHRPAKGGSASVAAHSLCGGSGCHDGVSAPNGCEVCHVDGPPAVDAAAAHPTDWTGRHGMGDLSTCAVCHEPSECRKCHGVDLPHDRQTSVFSHGSEAQEAGPACYECHGEATCVACHVIPMPHADDYLQGHSKDAVEQPPGTCGTCHLQSGCERCHLRHLHLGVAPEIIEKLEKISGVSADGEQHGGGSK